MGTDDGSMSFLPVPPSLAVRDRNPAEPWQMRLPAGFAVENDPPVRRILLHERVIGIYPVDDVAQERFFLLQVLGQGLLTASALAQAWGLHRNTLRNWAWRHQCFGLDGLVDGRLPARREALEAILRTTQELIAQQPRLSALGLGQALQQRGVGPLPRSTLRWLRVVAFGPKPLTLDLATVAESPTAPETSPAPQAGEPVADDVALTPAGTPADDNPLPPSVAPAQPQDDDRDGDGGASPPAAPESAATAGTAAPGAGQASAPPGHGAEQVELATVGVGVTLQGAPAATGRTLRHAGLALALPALQQLLDPLEPHLEQAWGTQRGYYRPRHLLDSFLLYLLADYRNPEQTKAAPARDFGPLLGRSRAPACGTLRRRLPPMAAQTELVVQLQRQLALRYLRLGWVQLGWWLVDGHFSPYFGQAEMAKTWWPQRRCPQRGYVQDWVHDQRGRPLWMHLTQGFEVFADQLPLLGRTISDLLAEAGQADVAIIVFDRGGYSSNVFTGLNAQGTGWVTWLKGAKHQPAAAFTAQGQVPGGAGQPPRTVYYTRGTHRVEGCNDHVPAIFWHDGDPQHQVALLSNLDQRQPGVWSPLQVIAMLTGRWTQENSFKTQTHDLDLDWTNGYAHEPCADTPVPAPRVRQWKRRLGERVNQLRRLMDRGTPRTPPAAARYRRRLGTTQGQITRLQGLLHRTPPTIPYKELGRPATAQLHVGRGTFFPVLRAAAHHLRLQLRDGIAAIFPDHREHDKVLRVLLHTPGRWVHGPDTDWVIYERPQLRRYAAAFSCMLDRANAQRPHAPGRPDHPLRFALENNR